MDSHADPLAGDRVVAILSDIADSLRIIAHRERSESPTAKAIRLLFEMGPDNVRAIARAVGVGKSTLYRCPAFRDALERVRATAQWSARNIRGVERDEL